MRLSKALTGFAVTSVVVLSLCVALMAATGFDTRQYGWVTLVNAAIAMMGVFFWVRWANRE